MPLVKSRARLNLRREQLLSAPRRARIFYEVGERRTRREIGRTRAKRERERQRRGSLNDENVRFLVGLVFCSCVPCFPFHFPFPSRHCPFLGNANRRITGYPSHQASLGVQHLSQYFLEIDERVSGMQRKGIRANFLSFLLLPFHRCSMIECIEP